MDGDFRVGPWLVEPSLNTASHNGTSHSLEPKVMEVLVCLAGHPGAPLSKEHLLRTVWPDTFISDGVLTRSISELRRLFEDDAKQPRFIQTIPKKGYRLLAPVTPLNGTLTALSLAVLDVPRENSRANTRRWMWRLAIPASAVLFLGVLLALNVGNLRARVWARTTIPQIHSLAVLPLKNLSGDPAQDYFAAGMTDELITYLSQLGGLRVISYTSTYTYKDTRKTLPEIARELGVDAVVEGSVQRMGQRVRVNAQLVYAPQETHLWAQSYDRDLLDSLSVQSTVASAIADQVRIKLTPAEQARLQTPRPMNLKALDAYLKGVDHLNHVGHGFGGEEVKMAAESFQEAIAQDPGFAVAYVKLAEAFGNEALPYPMESLPFQRAAIEKALSLAPNSSQVHLARGYFRFTRDWDWREREAEFKRALELNPNDPQAHVAFAEYLEAMGRLEDAMQERQRARELDPTIAELCTGFFRAKQYDLGIQILKKRLEITPNDGGTHLQLSDFYAYKGMEKDSIAEMQRGAALFGFEEAAQHVGHAFSGSGYRGALRALAKDMEKAYRQGRLDRPDAVAEVYTRLGEKDEAFRWLERAYGERNPAMVFLNVEPFWDPLRPDPRFKDLVRRVGLPQ